MVVENNLLYRGGEGEGEREGEREGGREREKGPIVCTHTQYRDQSYFFHNLILNCLLFHASLHPANVDLDKNIVYAATASAEDVDRPQHVPAHAHAYMHH